MTFEANVSAQSASNEKVTITITKADKIKVVVTALTHNGGNSVVPYSDVPGNYTAQASIAEDSSLDTKWHSLKFYKAPLQ